MAPAVALRMLRVRKVRDEAARQLLRFRPDLVLLRSRRRQHGIVLMCELGLLSEAVYPLPHLRRQRRQARIPRDLVVLRIVQIDLGGGSKQREFWYQLRILTTAACREVGEAGRGGERQDSRTMSFFGGGASGAAAASKAAFIALSRSFLRFFFAFCFSAFVSGRPRAASAAASASASVVAGGADEAAGVKVVAGAEAGAEEASGSAGAMLASSTRSRIRASYADTSSGGGLNGSSSTSSMFSSAVAETSVVTFGIGSSSELAELALDVLLVLARRFILLFRCRRRRSGGRDCNSDRNLIGLHPGGKVPHTLTPTSSPSERVT